MSTGHQVGILQVKHGKLGSAGLFRITLLLASPLNACTAYWDNLSSVPVDNHEVDLMKLRAVIALEYLLRQSMKYFQLVGATAFAYFSAFYHMTEIISRTERQH